MAHTEEKVLTKHPEGKRGVNISRAKYDLVRDSMLRALKGRGELTYTQLAERVEHDVKARFDGSVRWYVEAVKLDLEARRVVRRAPKGKAVVYRLVG